MLITLCSSAHFYRQLLTVGAHLEEFGFSIRVPSTALEMQAAGDFEVSHYKTWLNSGGDWDGQTNCIRAHLEEVERAHAILVVNLDKEGLPNYIGGNVLMEMGLAFFLRKPIFLYNEIPEYSPLYEEIVGMSPIVLHGDLHALRGECEQSLQQSLLQGAAVGSFGNQQ